MLDSPGHSRGEVVVLVVEEKEKEEEVVVGGTDLTLRPPGCC